MSSVNRTKRGIHQVKENFHCFGSLFSWNIFWQLVENLSPLFLNVDCVEENLAVLSFTQIIFPRLFSLLSQNRSWTWGICFEEPRTSQTSRWVMISGRMIFSSLLFSPDDFLCDVTSHLLHLGWKFLPKMKKTLTN